MEIICLSPLLLVLVCAIYARYSIYRRPIRLRGWAVITSLAVGAIFLPLTQRVWIPDFLGTRRTLATTDASSGYSFCVTQEWNFGDFYNTSLWITAPNELAKEFLLDADDGKRWTVPIEIDESTRTAKVSLGGRGPKVIHW